MKKTFLLFVIAVLGVTAANAQWYAGGSLGFWYEDDSKTTDFVIVPEVGYNINPKWAVGAELGFVYKDIDGTDNNAFFIAPYARYTYFNQGMVNLFVDGTVGFSTGKDMDEGFQIGLKPGVALNLTDKFSLVAKFGFLGYNDSYARVGNNQDGFGLDLTNNITFGFFVNF